MRPVAEPDTPVATLFAMVVRPEERRKFGRLSRRGEAAPGHVVRRVKLPGIALRAAHLAVLSSFALAQPLFDILGRNATFFVVRDSSGTQIVLLALAVTILPPALLILLELGAGLIDEFLALALHLVFVAVLAGMIALQVLKRLDGPTTVLLLAAVLLGLGAAVLYRRVRQVQSFLTLLTPAPVVFLALFLGGSDVSRLIFKSEPPVQAAHTRARTAVVLIVMDELSTVSLMNRNGQIDARRFPHFAALARDSTWYRTATTVDTHTERAVPAIFTGRVPAIDSLPTYADHPQNIFTLFGGNYRLHVFETLTSLCPRSLCAGAQRPAETEDESLRPGPYPAARARSSRMRRSSTCTSSCRTSWRRE